MKKIENKLYLNFLKRMRARENQQRLTFTPHQFEFSVLRPKAIKGAKVLFTSNKGNDFKVRFIEN